MKSLFALPALVVGAASAVFAISSTASAQQSTLEHEQSRMESIDSLRTETVWVQRALEAKLFTPSAELTEAHAKFLKEPGARGLTRILRGTRPDGEPINGLSVRGGGAYYSFATGSHSYNNAPDLTFLDGRFSSGFYGGQTGYVMGLGVRSLGSIADSADDVPEGLTESESSLWKHLWKDLRNPAQGGAEAAPKNFRRLRGGASPEGPGELFLLRFHSAGEHDHLVAFEVLDLDDYGATILWRVLKAWDVPKPPQRNVKERKPVPPAPKPVARELSSMSIERLFTQLQDVRDSAAVHLYSIPPAIAAAYEARIGDAGAPLGTHGIVRLLNRGAYPTLPSVRGHGAYYDFSTESHDYDQDPDIEFQSGYFGSGFAGGDEGFFIDMGTLPEDALRKATRRQDPGVDPELTKRWQWLTQLQPVQNGGRWSLKPEDMRLAHDLDIRDRVEIETGHSYLLRTAGYGDKDHETVLTVLYDTPESCIIAWHLIHRHAR